MLDNQAQQPERIGPYTIIDRIGQGGMGVVYRARHGVSGEEVAIKTIRHAAARHLAGLRLEIHALTGLHHPGVVRFVGEGVHEGLPWYAMEILEGQTLWDHIGVLWGGLPKISSEDILTQQPDDALAVTILEGGSTRPLPPPPQSPALSAGSFVGAARRPPRKHPAAGGRLVEVLTLVKRLCDALAFIHGQGIVHRDLKPGNVVIRPDGRPVLMDFGLASLSRGGLGREKLEASGLLVGTAAYIAPEQARGSFVDARADLYAVGCMLYELLTGRTPFDAPSVQEVIRSHLSDAPYMPSQLVDGIPPALDQLVLRLLAKKPRDRIGHADDVAAMLVALGADSDEGITLPVPRAYLYRPEISGRRDTIAELGALLLRVEGRSGGFVLISGESGVGKTYLVAEVARRAATRRVTVVTGECVPLAGAGAGDPATPGGPSDAGGYDDVRAAPLHPFRSLLQAVADRCREKGPVETARLLGARGKLLAPLEPTLAHLPGQEALPDPSPLPPGATRSRLFNALAETIAAFAWGEPLLLILDDLQWADELSLGFLSSLPASWFESTGVLLIGTYRAEEVTRPLEQLAASAGVRQIALQRLDDVTVGTIVSDMLALVEPPRPLVAFLAHHSSGNPFFVAEYLRSAVDEQLLGRDAAGRWQLAARMAAEADYESLPVPRSLRDLVARRLDHLSPGGRALVEMSSVLGRELDAELLERLVRAGDPMLDAFKELTARQVLEEVAPGRYRFVHDKLREVAYDGIADKRRRALHGEVAAAIETRSAGSDDFALYYPMLAHHYSVAENVPKAIDYLEKAGEQALVSSANQEALSAIGSALDLDEKRPPHERVPADRRAAWERQLGTAELGLGHLVASKEHFKRAAALLGWGMPEKKTTLVFEILGQLLRQIFHLLFPARFLGKGKEKSDRLLEAVRVYANLSLLYYFAADMPNVTLATLRGLNLAELGKPSPELAVAYANAQLAAGLGRIHGLAERYRRRGFETVESHGDGPSRCRVLALTVGYNIGIGQWQRARECADAGLALAKEIGFRRLWEEIKGCDNHRRIVLGEFSGISDAARLLSEPTLRTESQGQVWSALQIGLYELMARGDARAALEAAEEGIARMVGEVDRGDMIAAYATKAAAHWQLGQRAEALAAADRSAACVALGPPVIFYAGFGFGFVAGVYTQLWKTASQASERRAMHKKAGRALKVVFECARVLTMEEPQAWFYRAHYQLVAGQRKKAIQSFERSLAAAERLHNPFDEAIARTALGEHGDADPAARRWHLEKAAAFFASTDAPAPLARALRALARLDGKKPLAKVA